MKRQFKLIIYIILSSIILLSGILGIYYGVENSLKNKHDITLKIYHPSKERKLSLVRNLNAITKSESFDDLQKKKLVGLIYSFNDGRTANDFQKSPFVKTSIHNDYTKRLVKSYQQTFKMMAQTAKDKKTPNLKQTNKVFSFEGHFLPNTTDEIINMFELRVSQIIAKLTKIGQNNLNNIIVLLKDKLKLSSVNDIITKYAKPLELKNFVTYLFNDKFNLDEFTKRLVKLLYKTYDYYLRIFPFTFLNNVEKNQLKAKMNKLNAREKIAYQQAMLVNYNRQLELTNALKNSVVETQYKIFNEQDYINKRVEFAFWNPTNMSSNDQKTEQITYEIQGFYMMQALLVLPYDDTKDNEQWKNHITIQRSKVFNELLNTIPNHDIGEKETNEINEKRKKGFTNSYEWILKKLNEEKKDDVLVNIYKTIRKNQNLPINEMIINTFKKGTIDEKIKLIGTPLSYGDNRLKELMAKISYSKTIPSTWKGFNYYKLVRLIVLFYNRRQYNFDSKLSSKQPFTTWYSNFNQSIKNPYNLSMAYPGFSIMKDSMDIIANSSKLSSSEINMQLDNMLIKFIHDSDVFHDPAIINLIKKPLLEEFNYIILSAKYNDLLADERSTLISSFNKITNDLNFFNFVKTNFNYIIPKSESREATYQHILNEFIRLKVLLKIKSFVNTTTQLTNQNIKNAIRNELEKAAKNIEYFRPWDVDLLTNIRFYPKSGNEYEDYDIIYKIVRGIVVKDLILKAKKLQ